VKTPTARKIKFIFRAVEKIIILFSSRRYNMRTGGKLITKTVVNFRIPDDRSKFIVN